jgi:hypothetical protein
MMKISTPRYHCPLGRLLPDTTDPEAVKRDGWQAQHILVVSIEDGRLDWTERELIRRIGQRLYGRPSDGKA